jgi:hypothetical protein
MLRNGLQGATCSRILQRGQYTPEYCPRGSISSGIKLPVFIKRGGQHLPEWQLLFLAFNHALGGSAWAGISNFSLIKSKTKIKAQGHSRPLRGVSLPAPLLPWVATHGYSRPGPAGRVALAADCTAPGRDAPARRVFRITPADVRRDVPFGASPKDCTAGTCRPPTLCRPGSTGLH